MSNASLSKERDKDKTILKIKSSAKAEFLEKGFERASLRVIAKNAGVTTGALYAHFQGKSSLFESIVSPVKDELMEMFKTGQDEHFALIERGQTDRSLELSTAKLHVFMDYIYGHFDEFRLLVTGAEGSTLAGFIHQLVDLDVEKTLEYINAVKRKGYSVSPIDPVILNILTNAYFTAVFETVVRNITREQADIYIKSIADFFNAGWEALLHFKGQPST
ncbi:MAG: TetR/AcrR family transcriptional regulator [Deltaproteobacteria bacterium]|jgi:AcrR family transcriptional regulator|nr:TetR/AcrR family transcriptional regulator [Deltaproteobacteria bacterium]